MKIGIPKEIYPGEKRVAGSPKLITKLIKLGYDVTVETGAGDAAHVSDDQWREAGANIEADPATLWKDADIIIKVREPSTMEAALLTKGKTLISFFWPAQDEDLLKNIAAKEGNLLSVNCVPRISRAQKCDVL